MRKALLGSALIAALAAASVARAGGPDPKEEAITRFKRGLELYQEGALAPALVELRRAHALAPTYRVQFNIGQVCFELKDYACAMTSFEAYLKQGGDAIPAARRAAIRSDIAQLAPRVASLAITVDEAGAEVTIDDVVVGTSPLRAPVVVNAGRRKVSAQKAGRQVVTRLVDVAGAEKVTTALALPAAPVGPVVDRPTARWTTVSSVGAGVAGALTVGAVVTGVLARSAAATAKSVNTVAARDRASTLAITTGVLAGTSGATLIATFVGTYAHKSERAAEPRVKVGAGPGALVIFGSF